MQPKRLARYYWLMFKRLKGDPGFVARGVALGIFIGVTPTLPFHTLLILVLAFAVRGSKIGGLVAAMVVSNPLTFFPQYYLSYKVGIWVTGSGLSWDRILQVMETLQSNAGFSQSLDELGRLGWEAISVMLLGGCLLAAPLTVASYFFTLRFFSAMIKEKLNRPAGGPDNATLQAENSDGEQS